MYLSRIPSLPSMKPFSPENSTAYRFPAMLSVDLSRFQDFPPSSLLNKLPLPPHANPRFALGLNLRTPIPGQVFATTTGFTQPAMKHWHPRQCIFFHLNLHSACGICERVEMYCTQAELEGPMMLKSHFGRCLQSGNASYKVS